MDSKLGGKLVAFLVFLAVGVVAALWVRDQVRDLRQQYHGFRDGFQLPVPPPTAVAPAPLPYP